MRRVKPLRIFMFTSLIFFAYIMTLRTSLSLSDLQLYPGVMGSPTDDLSGAGHSWVNHLCPHYHLQDTTYHKRFSWQAPSEETIYFTETSCGQAFTGRQACAVESAALHHRNRRILVLVTAPSIDVNLPLVKILLDQPNVALSWLDLDKLFLNSPLHAWHEERQWLINGEHTGAFMSDAVRSVLMKKYGGTYMDLDAITLRPLPYITNYLGRLDSERITGAIISLVKEHPLTRIMVDSIPKKYKPFEHSSIGPELVMSSLRQLCPEITSSPITSRLKDASDKEEVYEYLSDVSPYLKEPEICTDITIFPEKMFYPIHYVHYTKERFLLFRRGLGYGKKFLRGTRAYSLHLYSSLTWKEHINTGGDSILEEVMKNNCPNVYQYLKENVKIL